MSSVATWVFDHLLRRHLDVRVRVHRAMLSPSEPSAQAASASFTTTTTMVGVTAYFVNVWNASPVRSVGITHVWLATDPETPILTRRPPARLEPDAQWETWIEARQLPPGASDVEHLARVKLTNGLVVESVPRDDVPAAGHVPG